jgi:hypothetical protein
MGVFSCKVPFCLVLCFVLCFVLFCFVLFCVWDVRIGLFVLFLFWSRWCEKDPSFFFYGVWSLFFFSQDPPFMYGPFFVPRVLAVISVLCSRVSAGFMVVDIAVLSLARFCALCVFCFDKSLLVCS